MPKEFDVTIVETLKMKVTVEADSMEEAEQDQEETLIEKQNSPSLEKMKTKGQQ